MSNDALKVAKGQRKEDTPVVLSTGVSAYIRPVAANLIEEVTARIPDPDVPMWHNPDRQKDEPNPNDPSYIRGLEKAERERGVAAIEAMILFGVDLVDGLPEDDTWLTKLKFLERRRHLDLSDFDLEDDLDLEFLYKKHIALAGPDLNLLSQASGVTEEDIASAVDTFQGS